MLLLGLSGNTVPLDGDKKRAATVPLDGDKESAASTTAQLPRNVEKNKKRNAPPTTAKQMLDNHVRSKWGNSIKNSLYRVQKLTYPVSRTDDFEGAQDGESISEEEVNEQDWPWVIPGAFVYTEQAANANGSGGPRRLRQPVLHLFTGSEKANDALFKGIVEGVSGVKVRPKMYNDMDTFLEKVYRSKSGLEAAEKHRNNPNHAAGGAKFPQKKDPEETETDDEDDYAED
jgi:hypothetical protein